MGIIIDSIRGEVNKEAHALIRVACPECKREDFVRAEVGSQLQVIDPDLRQRECRFCKQIVNLEKYENEKEIEK